MLRHELNINKVKKAINRPRQAVDETLFELAYRIPMTYVNTQRTIGTNVFTKDWDVLILLDTCRVDALAAIEPEYDFINNVSSIWSVGGRSPEWIAKTFENQYLAEARNTAYLSANVFAEKILVDRDPDSATLDESTLSYKLLNNIPTLSADQLGRFENIYNYEPVGKEGPLGHTDGGTPPRYITDRGIAVSREYDFDRIILHYLQPHPPYVANALEERRDLRQHEVDWWGYLAETGDVETIWNAYLDELRFVLDEIQTLLENVDAETVAISADHGEAFGEYWEYGHKTGSLNPKVRKVPWVITSATDKKTYTPKFGAPGAKSHRDDDEMTEQLEALGYKV